MKCIFNIHYQTFFGQQLFVCGNVDELGNFDENRAVSMNYMHSGHWEAEVEVAKPVKTLLYRYFVTDPEGRITREWGRNHFIETGNPGIAVIRVKDAWKNPSPEEKAMLTSTFLNVIMRPGENRSKVRFSRASRVVQFNIEVPRTDRYHKVCILGSHPVLGNWDPAKALVMECGDHFPTWTVQLNTGRLDFPLEYKYGIWDIRTREVVSIEEGYNRELQSAGPAGDSLLYIKNDYHFRHEEGPWKGAGVSVPVFSLHTEGSFGVGDFADLVAFIDWAKQTGLKMVQLLPVNETIAMHNWLDSYPYKAISVMALHPIYLRLEAIGRLNDPEMEAWFESQREILNNKEIVDYPGVLAVKSKYYKIMFDRDGEMLFRTAEYKAFFRENESWLVPYAAFVYLRDRMKSPDFRTWGEYSVYDALKIRKLSARRSPAWTDIAVHYFIQYHLHKQLKAAAVHARDNGIVLKGDIPIGVSPNSVEVWTEPELFHTDGRAGAPPDDFAVKGQNWGFPTYNWEAMARDGYSWWTRRMKKMAEYFDTYRIDHILGFFRIWEIPSHAVEALLGHFSPAMPVGEGEIRSFGIDFHPERMATPYIRHHLLERLFGEEAEAVAGEFMEARGDGVYTFREAFSTQQKVNAFFLDGIEEEELDEQRRRIRDGLFELLANVLFISTGEDQWHPRISMGLTSSFAELDDHAKERLMALYNHYFYYRHDDFWYRRGMEKLPRIVSAGNMLVCGEDLGMIPACVPRAMKELGILSLEIQRMPKDPKRRFAHPADSPYMAVCTTSTHDMPTIRGWWEEDREKTQWFFNHELGHAGQAPYFAEPWICKEIVVQHLWSPAMWVTLPIQDFMAMDGKLRWEKTQKEQINHPANVRHRWRFKMKQRIGDLQAATEFNEMLRELVKESGRNSET